MVMAESFLDELEGLTSYLEDGDLDASLNRSNLVISVGSQRRGDEAPCATIEFSEEMYRQYMDAVSIDYLKSTDSSSRAVGMVRILIVEMMTKDHGGGSNLVRMVTLRRGVDGTVVLVADQDRRTGADRSTSAHDHEWRAERPLGWRSGS